MVKNTSLTSLNYLVLAILNREPQSGYRICRSIEAMPIGAVSASPGSIYPSLQKLLNQGYLVAKTVGGDVKPRKLYRPSAKGKRALTRWLRLPISADSAIRNPESLFVRMSFVGDEPSKLRSQMKDLHTDLSKKIGELRAYQRASKADMSDGGKLALDLSITMAKALRDWVGNYAETKSQAYR